MDNPNKTFLKITNEVSPIVDEQQCVIEIANFVEEFDAALTLETERLKKDALKEKEKTEN